MKKQQAKIFGGDSMTSPFKKLEERAAEQKEEPKAKEWGEELIFEKIETRAIEEMKGEEKIEGV